MLKWISLILLLPLQAIALDLQPGDRIELINNKAIPLHQLPRPSLMGRAPAGSQATLLRKEGAWILIQLDSGKQFWIIGRNVAKVLAKRSPSEQADNWHVWSSGVECEQVVKTGSRLKREDDNLRIVSWNIRWFPTGDLFDRKHPTDIAWLSCVLTWLDADIIAVQEFQTSTSAIDAVDSLLDGLIALTGHNWQAKLQPCGTKRSQHVGYVYNADRVLTNTTQDAPKCSGELRPSLTTYFQRKGGIDFHLTNIHLDDGRKNNDYQNRKRTLKIIAKMTRKQMSQDSDYILLGSFNPIGSNQYSGETEMNQQRHLLLKTLPRFNRLNADYNCSQYNFKSPQTRDFFAVTAGMKEAEGVQARVEGICRLAQCEPLDQLPQAYTKLSDHCPVVLDIKNKDLDGIRYGEYDGRPSSIKAKKKPVPKPQASLIPGYSFLTQDKHYKLSLSNSFSNSQINRFTFQGVEILDTFLVGAVEAENTDRDVFSSILHARYGIGPRAEIELKIPFLSRREHSRNRSVSQSSSGSFRTLEGQGLGDVEFGFSVQFTSGGLSSPHILGKLRLKSTTGKSPYEVNRDSLGIEKELPTGSGFLTLEPSTTFLYRLDPAIVYGTLGYAFTKGKHINQQIQDFDIIKVSPGDVFRLSFGSTLALNRKLTYNIGYKHDVIKGSRTRSSSGEFESSSLDIGSLLVGIGVVFTKKVRVNIDMEFGVTDDAPDVTLSMRTPILNSNNK